MTLTRRHGYRGGAALPLLAGAALMTAGLAVDGPLRAAIELPLALLLPGASVLAAARGRRPARPAIDVGLAVVLSFAAWILIGLTCYVLAQPFTTAAVILGANLIVLVSAAVCVARAAPLSTLVGTTVGRVPTMQLLTFALAILAVVGIVAGATRELSAPEPHSQPYTEVALAGNWAGVQSSVRGHGTHAAGLGREISVANHTHAPRTYRVVPAMRDARWGTQTFELAAGEKWRGSVSGTIPKGGCLHRLLVSVHETGAPAPVGSVTLWFQNGTKLPGKMHGVSGRRILLLSDLYAPVIGGAEGHVGGLARALTDRGHTVSVATAQVPGTPPFELDEGVRIHRVRGLVQRAGVHESARRPFHPPFPDPLVTRALWRIVQRERPDVVHAHSPIVHSYLPLKRLSRARLVLTMHDYGAICALRVLMRDGAPCSGPGLLKCNACAGRAYRSGQRRRTRDGAAGRAARARRRRCPDRGERGRRTRLLVAAAADRGGAELPPRRAPWHPVSAPCVPPGCPPATTSSTWASSG